ncbi:M20/M25/M40 family metallo-hydrolase [Polymorphobacter arshaanensis]|uniref:M20/M25/M40 family metallo-hydrolase n=1 Tax=Glacieibacterium arshaanense TaxID=2511025 RepID=A0A4Y9EJG0_9SPHN|nr:M20/M25/M40 family metallo-hydrolase [Polymorphobacter arshaanensis]TFU00325.1 M20/M25/M40 family metallo-hydrolase [Polymorphobacter arshaanensis]
MLKLLGTALFAAALALPVAAQTPRPDQAQFRALYKELVETNTTHSTGSCTLAAQRMAAHLKTAGFADADLNVFVPPGFPLDGGLIATLPGSDPKAAAIILLAHLDVVEAKREDWTRDPFVLIEENGYFYGRGSIDDKSQAAIFTDSMARLKAKKPPLRTIKLVLTCGEESGARINNIRWLIDNHRDWLNAAFALNEGGSGTLDAQGKPQTLGFQAGEKVSQNFRLEATNPGGHSSMPRPDNAIYDLSRGLVGLADYQFPVMFNDTTRGYFGAMAGIVGGDTGKAMTALLANPQDVAADAIVSKNAAWHSMLRTTCVATLTEGGHAINALPQRASANVNCRMFPGDPAANVQAQLVKAMGSTGVTVTAVPPVNPTPPPPPLTPLVFGTAKHIAAKHFPGVPVLPMMLTGATDGRFLTGAGVPTYGVPGAFLAEDSGMHGLNEHVSVAGLYAQRDYLFDLIQAYAATKDTQ